MTKELAKPRKRKLRANSLRHGHLVLPGREIHHVIMMAKYQAFVSAYLTHLNATKASVDAGFLKTTRAQQHQCGSALMKLPIVRKMLVESARDIMAKFNITPERVWNELGRLSFSNIGDCFDDAGVRKMGDIPEDARRAIASYKIKRSVRQTDGGEIITEQCEVRMAPKLEALEKLMRLLNMVKGDEGDNAGDLAAKFLLAMQEGRRRAFEHLPASK